MLRHDGFDTQLEDQDAFIQPTPALEIALGELVVQPDYGVVTGNEFGRIEIGDEHMDDLGGYGLAARDGRSEIGFDDESVGEAHRRQVERQEDIGSNYVGYDDLGGFGLAARDGRSEIGGYAPAEGRTEIGDGWFPDVPGPEMSTIGGYAPAEGRSEIGGYAPAEGRTEIGFDDLGGYGLAARDGRSEIGFDDESVGVAHRRQVAVQEAIGRGYAPAEGRSEIGGFGLAARDGRSEIGFGGGFFDTRDEDFDAQGYAPVEGRSELLGALVEVVKKARDNRQPPPPMVAVDVDSPFPDTFWDESLVEIIGETVANTGDPTLFSRLREFMQRAGSGIEPRIVCIDTESNYNRMRQEGSPELMALKHQFEALKQQVEAHAADPHAHEAAEPDMSMDDALTEDIQDLVLLGAAVQQHEADKKLDFWMPKHFDGYATAWREDDFIGAAMALPSPDGKARIATSLESTDKCVREMVDHATQAGVDTPELLRYIAGMGCVMGAGTVMKEVAAATKSIAQRPEMKTGQSFRVRIQPEMAPALSALFMLVMACRAGDKKACEEWEALSAMSPPQIKQAMVEAAALAKAATVA